MDRIAYRKKDFAEHLGVSDRTVTNWLHMGLRFAKIGGITLIKPDWFNEFLEKNAEVINQGDDIEAGLAGLKADIKKTRKRTD